MKKLDFLDALNGIPEEYVRELTAWQESGEQLSAEQAEPSAAIAEPEKEVITMKQQKKQEIPVKWLKPVTIGVFGTIAACIAAVIWVGAKNAKTQKPDVTPAAQIAEVTTTATGTTTTAQTEQTTAATVTSEEMPLPYFEGLAGRDYREVIETLEAVYRIPELRWQTSDDVPRGQVIEVRQTENTGDCIVIVSSGTSDENYVIVPNLIGIEMSEAVKTLEDLGLAPNCVDEETDSEPVTDSAQYYVIEQDGLIGDQVERGTQITLTLRRMETPSEQAQEIRISTPILAEKNEWITVDDPELNALIDGMDCQPADKARFDEIDGGGFLLQFRYDDESTLTFELFEGGLVKCTSEGFYYPADTGNPDYLEDVSGNGEKLVWKIQEILVEHYPQ